MALVILTVFVSIPTMIATYSLSFSVISKFLSLFLLNWHFLHTFVDSFQGCYKDGTESGTFDCRGFQHVLLLQSLLYFIDTVLCVCYSNPYDISDRHNQCSAIQEG